jgi:transcriptional regulator of acetoin/glycerol metabolism
VEQQQMGQLQHAGDGHGARLKLARELFFVRGDLPEGLVDPLILRSWERCRRFGLVETGFAPTSDSLDRMALKTELERQRDLVAIGKPIMEHVFEQIRESSSMVILADANGLLLHTQGDPDFVDRAHRVTLSPGASWDETCRGTNAIGTALAEELPAAIFGAEHFLEHNAFLTCCASPIFSPDGRMLGVIDISGDYRNHQRHTLGLVRLASQLVERRLFEHLHSRDVLLSFHRRPEYLGSPKEGLAAVSHDGQVLAINQAGLEQLGIRRVDVVRRDFSMVFETNFSTLIDRLRSDTQAMGEISVGGHRFCVQVRGQFPVISGSGRIFEEPALSAKPARRPDGSGSTGGPTLDTLNAGDAQFQSAIERARRILGKDIPILIQGESGAGKEMFAKAFHNSGPRRSGPFVALNCAAIPETLIESELFGYQGGAFTGARKEGAPGKIQQAHGGTLFLDEIGDMPLNLQARLLRVLQERSITPLGSCRAVQVDISLVCATHRKLREEVARGGFREDLYYRLNGLCVTLPALRERHDLRELAMTLVRHEAGRRENLRFSETALRTMELYSWPGNIRQLNNVIRVAIALLDDDEDTITDAHLPEEMFESSMAGKPGPCRVPDSVAGSAASEQPAVGSARSLEEIGRQAALRALDAAGGNISAAARQLGISRNTLYRKLGRF